MAKNDVLIRYAFLTTSERLPDRFLFSGKLLDEENLSASLFYLFEISSPWSACVKVKKSILEVLENSFHGDLNSDEEFEKLLQKVNEALNSLAKKGENSWIGNINGIIGLFSGNEVSLAQTGRISGYIFRKGKISSLTENFHLKEELHPLKTFSDITSGKLIPDDRIVFGNMELYNHQSLDRIRRTMEGLPVKEALQILFRNLRRSKVLNVSAILVETEPSGQIEKKPDLGLPETASLAEAEETFTSVLKKRYTPVIKTCLKTSKKAGIQTFKFLLKNGKVAVNKTSAKIKEKYPQAKKLLGKSGRFAGSTMNQAKNSLEPQLNKIKNSERYQKIKVKTFERKGNSSEFISASTKVAASIASTLLSIAKLLLRKENRKYLYGLLIILFVFFGYLKIRANNASVTGEKEKQQIVLSYDKAKEIYDQAKEDAALGKTNSTDKFSEALALAKKAMESNATKDKAEELIKEIQETLDKTTKTKRLYNTEPNIVFNDKTKKIILAGTDIYGFDSEGKVYSANTQDKEAKLVASIGKENGEVASLSYSPNKNNIFIYTRNSKLLSFDAATKTGSELNLSEGQWEKATGIANFVTNLYLLDKETGQIWKHGEADNTYSKGTAYLNSKNTIIKDGVDIAIDGNIFLLSASGSAYKFSRGAIDQSFSLKNTPAPNSKIGEPVKIYTDEDVNYIFVLDKELNRVLRFDKSGEFTSQYALNDMVVDDFVVNGKVQKLWLMSGGKVFEIDL